MRARFSLLLLLTACGGTAGPVDLPSESPSPSPSPSPVEPAGLELGTGAQRFEEMPEGATVAFATGPQGGGNLGGVHLFISLRTSRLEPRDATARLWIKDATSGESLSDVVLYPDLAGDRAHAEAVGLRAILNDCLKAAGRALVVGASVEEVGGRVAREERRVMGGGCPREADPSGK